MLSYVSFIWSMFFNSLNDRHSLRLLRSSDATELFALTDHNRDHLRRWLPWLDVTKAVADTETFIELALHQYAAGQSLTAVILYDRAIVGVVGYNQIDRQQSIGHIGYWLGAAYQGQGLMTASCQVLIEHGCQVLKLDRVSIACATGNHPSKAIPQRLGFTYEKTIPNAEWLYDHFVDHEVYVQHCFQ
jgi:ribosomal-protein-serine acetyltransferase